MEKQRTDRPARKQVNLRSITTKTETFQFRHVEVDQHHVDELATVLETGRPLDRLTLWTDPETGELVVVDGHHRLAAYRQVEWRGKIPADIYSCGIEEARLMALRENGKTRLPLTKDERMDAAWALVCLGSEVYSKRVIQENTGVGNGTVATMRRTLKALLELDPEGVPPRHWWQALATVKDREQREYTEEERDAMIEAKTAQLDDKIGKALGHMAANQIEAACAVVAKRLGRQGLRFLIEEYWEDVDPYGLSRDDDAEF
jgi:hypothetical protein